MVNRMGIYITTTEFNQIIRSAYALKIEEYRLSHGDMLHMPDGSRIYIDTNSKTLRIYSAQKDSEYVHFSARVYVLQARKEDKNDRN
jgi:hypothetical protein